MPALQKKLCHTVGELSAAEVKRPAVVIGDEVAVPSPVHGLQSLLEMAYFPEPEVKAWPVFGKLAFLGGATVASWGGLLIGVRLFLK